MKRFVCLVTALVLALSLAPLTASAEDGDPYTDMPADDWAREAVLKAREYGLMMGQEETRFGTGSPISRQEFATVVVRMMGWEPVAAETDAYTDLANAWGREAVNTAAAHGAALPGETFRPDVPITRREMAVMLVLALGLGDMAELELPLPFADVREDAGYIAVAYDIRMTNGTSAVTFDPERTAVREQAAAMLVRVYERYMGKTTWTHGFYAIASHSQMELAKKLDAVTLGWSRMTYENGTAVLNTTSAGGNEYAIPSGWKDAVSELRDAGAELHLGVFMTDAGSALSALLTDGTAMEQAVNAITEQVKALGLGGATLDFEGLRARSRDAYTAFLQKLDRALEAEGLTLWVTVMPTTADGVYYDGYDYRAVGELADRVILMAHDYAPLSMPESLLGSEYYRTAALTPRSAVYVSLRAACDPETGVRDLTKLALNLSMSASAWETDENGKLISVTPQHPAMDTVYRRLSQGAQRGWSETLQNPYATYTIEEGRHVFLWYEDERSVEAKIDLSHLFGLTAVSVWRLGTVPAYPDEGLDFDIASLLAGE